MGLELARRAGPPLTADGAGTGPAAAPDVLGGPAKGPRRTRRANGPATGMATRPDPLPIVGLFAPIPSFDGYPNS